MYQERGFTLLELMIAVAVLAILAMLAMPAYSDYIKRGKITEATSGLADLRVKMEQWYQDNRTYVGGPCTTTSPYFTFDCPATPTASAFTIRATGVAAQGMGGFVYTIDQNNAKASTVSGHAGWTGAPDCWVTKKGGQC